MGVTVGVGVGVTVGVGVGLGAAAAKFCVLFSPIVEYSTSLGTKEYPARDGDTITDDPTVGFRMYVPAAPVVNCPRTTRSDARSNCTVTVGSAVPLNVTDPVTDTVETGAPQLPVTTPEVSEFRVAMSAPDRRPLNPVVKNGESSRRRRLNVATSVYFTSASVATVVFPAGFVPTDLYSPFFVAEYDPPVAS